MIKVLVGMSLLAATCGAGAADEDQYMKFREGIIGTRFISDSGSSMYSYWLLTDLKVIRPSNIELKLINRSSIESDNLSEKDTQELVMVNCKKKAYTTSKWASANDSNFGYKRYRAGDVMKWTDDSEYALINYGYGRNVQEYFDMICKAVE
jgi:hypothetical protein